MGNREDLLAGAQRAIRERGAARVTARDIAREAGVSLAAIGYHFGSKDELVTAALMEAVGDGIGDGMEEIVLETASLPLLDGFARLWERMPAVFEENREALLASLENTVRMLRQADGANAMADGVARGHVGLAEQLRAARPELDEEDVEVIAKLDFALAQSLGIMWLLNPSSLPTGPELARAVTALAR